MIIRLTRLTVHPDTVMRRAGYVPFRDPRSGEDSYVRRLATHFYPRFHVYAEIEAAGMKLALHLDQKQPSYQGFRKHSGEYDGPVVEAEADRIYQMLRPILG